MKGEVRRYQGGFRIFVLLPGERRRRLVPPTHDTRQEAEAALDLWNSDVEGVDLPQCVHDIARASCGTCRDGKTDQSHAGRDSDVVVPFERTDAQGLGPPRNGDYRDTTEQKIAATRLATEKRFAQ